ncbi:probable Actin-like protein ARP6 [Saccharomycodes ludwigii]|uniref:Actin-like protein ARP6 n=1 Tax=Saccharomycodes ludwigii TaxID=36035 RepID=A0A376B0X2_9ASCO|nr:hypothetical protein SCDLUD_001694 [Saccharomycodes ludwigii]KAH3901910.1 hypothetical protein SCDLUD_001694 [Saccharomycodes ludwigii]SSD58281.1 probable Actin-like protein ARP6 [Saccharomycodes ludwigii]
MMSPFIIDNGSYQMKFGYSNHNKDRLPFTCYNCIATNKYSTTYIGNQIDSIKDISQVYIKRPIERGQLTLWELESNIWDYCFYNPDEFKGLDLSDNLPSNLDLILSETIFTIPELSKNTDQVVFEEYGFNSLYKSPVAGYVPFNINAIKQGALDGNIGTALSSNSNIGYNDFQLVIDSGFNCTWVIPIVKGVIYYKAVKKLDIGGRFLTGFLKELVSFRHYDVMDETILVNNIKETCIFMSPASYTDSFKRINKTDEQVEYVLPDFQTSFKGYVNKQTDSAIATGHDYQSIILKDELFAVPETFFHPEIANLINKPGIVEVILESISMVPEVIRPLLISNIVLIGGNFKIKNFASRLLTELQRQCPTDWNVRISLPYFSTGGNPQYTGYKSMCVFSETEYYRRTRVTKKEYYEHGADWCTRDRFGYQQQW